MLKPLKEEDFTEDEWTDIVDYYREQGPSTEGVIFGICDSIHFLRNKEMDVTRLRKFLEKVERLSK